ncbi:MAG TPA: alpha/beta fold hydrolase, partial [Blastocatellia bacterium]|nr:alpha/beta fold hydrolase [Blastocatellia bacterium]
TMTKESLLERLARTPFIPPPKLRNAHAQTLAGTVIPRRFKAVLENSQPRFFDTAPGVKVLAHCSWQKPRGERPTLVLLHGMEGSTESRYMLGTAEKALGEGFNAVRVNTRNCGGTEHLAPTLYHAGLTEDLRQILAELAEGDGLNELYIAGFSLGGNVVLKLAGEYGDAAPGQLKGVIAVSPSIDLNASADAIELRSNVIYNMRFVWSLRTRMRRKARLFPERYDESRLRGVWSIRKFDDVYTAPHSGFGNVANYYARASSLQFISRITVPTLVVHAQDDPFIPFESFNHPDIEANPNVVLLAPRQGGHVGFISADREGEDRFWAERMAVEFVKLVGSDRATRD